MYPFPEKQLKEVLEGYSGAEIVRAHEEPENMGTWRYMERECRTHLGVELRRATREASPTPATGSLKMHQKSQEHLVARALSSFPVTSGTSCSYTRSIDGSPLLPVICTQSLMVYTAFELGHRDSGQHTPYNRQRRV